MALSWGWMYGCVYKKWSEITEWKVAKHRLYSELFFFFPVLQKVFVNFIKSQGAKYFASSYSCPLVNSPFPLQPELLQWWPQGRGIGGKMWRFQRFSMLSKESEHSAIKRLGSLWLPKRSFPFSVPLLQLSPYIFWNGFLRVLYNCSSLPLVPHSHRIIEW